MDSREPASPLYDNSLLLLIERKGIITKVECPFQVICKQSIDELIEGSVLTVEEVISTEDDKLVFIIDGLPFYHHHFLLFKGMFPH